MDISAGFEFIAENPPSILIALGGLGWLLCAFTSIQLLCDVWPWLLGIGIVLQVLWLIFVH